MNTASRLTIAAALFVSACAAPLAGQDAGTGKLILGFETEELRRKKDNVWGDMRATDIGCDFWVQFEHGEKRSRAWTWRCRKGDSTEGKQALVASIGPGRRQKTFETSDFQQRFYPAMRSRGEAALILTTFQWMAHTHARLTDWSDYDLLRVDVKADRRLEIRTCLEDETIEPPVVRVFDVPAAKWVTLEVDLRAAEKARDLDLAHITNIYLLGRPDQRTTVRVDNIRLVRKDAPDRLKVLRDNSPMTVPRPKFPAKPEVPTVTAAFTPDRSSVTLKPPVEIARGTVVPMGFIAAVDNRHLLMGYVTGSNRWNQRSAVAESHDGGATWKRLSPPMARNFDHGTSRGSVLSTGGDAVVVSSGPGCAGIGIPTPRQHATKYTFDGTGWQRRGATVLDCDIRHCGSTAWVVRLARGPHKGRLWASWGALDRMRRLVVHCRYSDDDGRTWWHEGKSAMIPDSPEKPMSLNSYSYQQPRCTYFRGHVAVFWQDARGLRWSRYDGKKWSKAEAIDVEAVAKLAVSENESFRVPGSVVTVGEDEVFLTAWNRRGVFRYDGKKWIRELTGADDAGSLTICSEKDVMLITMGHTEQPPEHKRVQLKRKTRILAYRRKPDGTWAKPLDVSGGKVTLHEYRQMTGVIVPPASPPNFAPVAFSDGTKIKLVKVPVLETED